MIMNLILGMLLSALIGMGILMLGVNGDRGQTKAALGTAIFWLVASFVAALTCFDISSAMLWMVMVAVATGITIQLALKLWREREIKWWGNQ